MCASALMAYLESSSKVVDYPDTFFPYYAMDLLSDSYFEFCNCFWIVLVHMVFWKAPKMEMQWIQIWWMRWPFWKATFADQSACKATIKPFHNDVSCMGVAPSCLNHCSSWCTPQRAESVLQKLLRITM